MSIKLVRINFLFVVDGFFFVLLCFHVNKAGTNCSVLFCFGMFVCFIFFLVSKAGTVFFLHVNKAGTICDIFL